MSQKFLFEYTLDKEIEEKVTEKKVIEGKEVEVTETVKTIKPAKYAILKNSRRMTEKADLFFAKTVGFYTKQGLLSVHQINKRYYNDDGPFNKDEEKVMENLADQKAKLGEKYFGLSQIEKKTPEQDKEEREILEEILELQKRMDSISTPYVGIFNQTAEYKARNKLITFWTVFLLHKQNENGEWERVVDVKDYEDGEEILFDIEDDGTPFEQEAIKKGMFFISYWASGGDTSEQGLKNTEKAYLMEFGDYLGRSITDLLPDEKPETTSNTEGDEDKSEGEGSEEGDGQVATVPDEQDGAGSSDGEQQPEDNSDSGSGS